MAISPDEQLQKLDDEISQLKARKQAILNREKQKQKKERNRRLIQYGELAEEYFNCKDMPINKFEELLKLIIKIVTENKKSN